MAHRSPLLTQRVCECVLRRTQSWCDSYPTQIVLNPCTYPNFLRFLCMESGTRSCIQATNMTFSVSRDHGAFEWGGSSLGAVFCQPRHLLDPGHWRLLYDIVRFNVCARRLLDPTRRSSHVPEEISLGKYLRREKYSNSFKNNYLIVCAVAAYR